MYTSLGYKPLDKNLNKISDFYEKCAKQQIPIMTHCTPGGNYSYEREDYLKYKKNNEGKEYKKKVDIREDLNIIQIMSYGDVTTEDLQKSLAKVVRIYRERGICRCHRREFLTLNDASVSAWSCTVRDYPPHETSGRNSAETQIGYALS